MTEPLPIPPAEPGPTRGPGLASLLPWVRVLAPLLSQFGPPDPEALLRRRLLELQVAQAEGQGVVPVLEVDAGRLLDGVFGVAFVGQKGCGKTVAACAAASLLAAGRPVLGIDWPNRLLPQGWRSVRAADALSARECVVLVDEAVLRVPKRAAATWEAAALARQRGCVWVWTTQAATGLDVDVLRQGVVRCWMPGESAFEREELRDEAAAARRVLRVFGVERGGSVTMHQGAGVLVRWSLPEWWTESHSRLWR